MASLDPGVTGKRPQGAARNQARSKPKMKTKAATPASSPMKRHEPPAGSPFMTIPAAGKKYWGLSKNGSYDAAERGDFGKLYEVGRRKFVVVPVIEARIQAAADEAAE